MTKRFFQKSGADRTPDFAFNVATELSAAALGTLKKYQEKLEQAADAEREAKKILSDWFSAQMRSKGLIAENELVSGYIKDKTGELLLFKRAITSDNKPILETAKPATKAKAII